MMKSKKGQFFSFFLVMSVMFVLLGAYLVIGEKKDKMSDNKNLKEFGEKQKRIFLTYQEAEMMNFELTQKAKILWQKAVYDLAERGGFTLRSDCGFDEINFWNKNKTYWCLDEEKVLYNIMAEIRWFFREGHRDYFDQYVWDNKNYQFFIKDNNLIITAEGNINLTDQEGKFKIKYIYELQNNFAVEMNYNASEYNEILRETHILVENCYGNSDLNQCVNNEINNFGDKDAWTGMECFDDEKKCYFTYESEYEILIKTFNTFSNLPINYRFGLNMGEETVST